MTTSPPRAIALSLLLATWVPTAPRAADDPPRTGPRTEKRFPPLKVPPGFKATLFACDPLIEYPSAIAAGPRAGAIFVAIDYMTGLGTEIVRRDEIRLVEDTDGDGYADKATVYRERLQLDPGARLSRRDTVRDARPVPLGGPRPRRGRRGGRAARPADRPGAAARGEPLAAALRQRRRRRARRLALPGPRRQRLRRAAARGRPAGATTAAASCAAGPTAATCTSSPPACGTSTTWPSTRS